MGAENSHNLPTFSSYTVATNTVHRGQCLQSIIALLNKHILKLIDRLRATRWTPPDYRQTDNSNGLVMVIRNYHWLNSASRVLISTCSAPPVETGECKQTHTVWPWPLTYDLDIQSQASQGQGRPSCQKSRSKVKRFKQESAHRQTDGHTLTHTDATKRIISLYAVDKNEGTCKSKSYASEAVDDSFVGVSGTFGMVVWPRYVIGQL